MLICALLLTASLAWSLYDEAFGQRPWKGIQQQFVSRYTKYLKSIKSQAGKTEAEVKQDPEYQTLDADAQSALEKVKPDISDIDHKVVQIQSELDAVTEPFQNQRGKLTVINYNVEIASAGAKDKYRKQAQAKRAELVEVDLPAADGSGKKTIQQMNYEQLEKLFSKLSNLGALKTYKGCKGDSNIYFDVTKGKSVTAGYAADATFEKGEAHFDVRLIQTDGQWQFLMFKVNSPIFFQ